MVRMMGEIVEEMDGLPVYFQKRAAKKMQAVLREVVIDMLLQDYEVKTRYGSGEEAVQ